MAPHYAMQIADFVVTDGFDHHKHAVAELCADARRRHVSEVLVEVTSDEAEPRPVRERALGKLVMQYCRAA